MYDLSTAEQASQAVLNKMVFNLEYQSGPPTYYTAAEIRKHCQKLLPANWQIQSPYSFTT